MLLIPSGNKLSIKEGWYGSPKIVSAISEFLAPSTEFLATNLLTLLTLGILTFIQLIALANCGEAALAFLNTFAAYTYSSGSPGVNALAAAKVKKNGATSPTKVDPISANGLPVSITG